MRSDRAFSSVQAERNRGGLLRGRCGIAHHALAWSGMSQPFRFESCLERLLVASHFVALSEAETLSFLAEEKIDDGEEGVENYWKMHLYRA